jgi:2-polyprenyl-6-hydroxyphenyl methylase/3-demethylubiquinone-9 3-methyltransferase
MSDKPGNSIQFHDNLAESWELKYKKSSFLKRMKAFLSALDTSDLNKQRWLDAGCGTGTLSRELAARGCRVTGVDASSAMVEVARKSVFDGRRPLADDPVFQVVETIERLDFSGSTFDGIICSSVLEYVGEPNRAIEEFYRILRPGGTLLVSVPNNISLLRNAQKIFYKTLNKCRSIQRPTYLNFSKNSYTRESFNRLLDTSGFTVVSSIYYDPYIPDYLLRMGLGGSLIIFLAKKNECH